MKVGITDWAKWATAPGPQIPKGPPQAPIVQFVSIWFIVIWFESTVKGTTKVQFQLANMQGLKYFFLCTFAVR